MKLIKLIAARVVISQCAKEKLPAQVAYKFVKFLKATDNDEIFYNEKLKGILSQYAKKDANGNFVHDGNGIALIPETAEACKQEIYELDNTVIEMPATFTIDEFSGLSLSMTDILALESLLIEEKTDG